METRDLWKKLGEMIGVSDSVALAAGEVKKVEIARSGKFNAKIGGKTELTPEMLAWTADNFDSTRDHKIKLGHKPIDTDTPDYGDITGLEFDRKRDRLLAHIKPTDSLVEKNRKGEFKRLSMELGRREDGNLEFNHLSFLGAHRPAISELADVSLAEGLQPVFLAAGPDDDEDVDTEPKPTEKVETKPESVVAAAAAEEAHMSEEIQAENKALKERLAEYAAADVNTFLASDAMVKVIPIGVLENVKRVLTALATADADGTAGAVMFAGDGKETKASPYQAMKTIFAAWPEKTSEVEKKELAKDGMETPIADPREFAGADPESVQAHLAAQQLIAEEKAKGNVLSYIDGLRKVEARRVQG